MHKYEIISSVIDGFEKFLDSRTVDQEGAQSIEVHDRECGCCVGAHWGRYISEEYEEAGVFVPRHHFGIDSFCDHIGVVLPWAKRYAEWRKEKIADDKYDFDGWEGLSRHSEDDRAEEFYNDTVDEGNYYGYFYTDGICAMQSMFGLDHVESFALEKIISTIVHGADSPHDSMWDKYDWNVQKEHIGDVFRVGVLALDIYLSKNIEKEWRKYYPTMNSRTSGTMIGDYANELIEQDPNSELCSMFAAHLARHGVEQRAGVWKLREAV